MYSRTLIKGRARRLAKYVRYEAEGVGYIGLPFHTLCYYGADLLHRSSVSRFHGMFANEQGS